MEDDEKIDITDDFMDWLHEQSKERLDVAMDRANKRDTEWWDDQSYMQVLQDILHEMYMKDVLGELQQHGMVEGHALPDGEVAYTLPGDTLERVA